MPGDFTYIIPKVPRNEKNHVQVPRLSDARACVLSGTYVAFKIIYVFDDFPLGIICN